jgi:hypothetical protein
MESPSCRRSFVQPPIRDGSRFRQITAVGRRKRNFAHPVTANAGHKLQVNAVCKPCRGIRPRHTRRGAGSISPNLAGTHPRLSSESPRCSSISPGVSKEIRARTTFPPLMARVKPSLLCQDRARIERRFPRESYRCGAANNREIRRHPPSPKRCADAPRQTERGNHRAGPITTILFRPRCAPAKLWPCGAN